MHQVCWHQEWLTDFKILYLLQFFSLFHFLRWHYKYRLYCLHLIFSLYPVQKFSLKISFCSFILIFICSLAKFHMFIDIFGLFDHWLLDPHNMIFLPLNYSGFCWMKFCGFHQLSEFFIFILLIYQTFESLISSFDSFY